MILLYIPQNNEQCWASQTPCSYGKKFSSKKFMWMDMVFVDDK